MTEIRTRRLLLRPFREEDYDDLFEFIHKDYRRKGYACEALSAVVAHAFSAGAHRVFAECDPRNTASWKLLEKAGLKREAHFRKNIYFRKDGNGAPVWKDTFVYAALDEDALNGNT